MSARRVIAQVLVLAVLVLAQTDTTSASGRDEQRRLAPPNSRVPGVGVDDLRAGVPGRGDAAPRNPKTTTTSPANDCSTVLDAGVLPGAGGILFGDTRGQANDFDACGAGAESAGDEIWEFQVESTGRWTFSTCNSSSNPEGPTNNQWDTILAINEDLGAGILCPGVELYCNDDAECDTNTCGGCQGPACLGSCSGGLYTCVEAGGCPPGETCDGTTVGNTCTDDAECDVSNFCYDGWLACNDDSDCAGWGEEVCGGESCRQSRMQDVCLQAGENYWLIVDGWNYQSGGYYGVEYVKTTEACTDDAQCDDGDICNGSEECVDGCCVRGPPPCGPLEGCLWLPDCPTFDPCTAWATDETLRGDYAPQCYIGCNGSLIADDIQLHPGSGHELISYQVYTQARWVISGIPEYCYPDAPLGSPYDITTKLLTTAGDGECLPDQEIPGTRCDLTEAGVSMGGGSPADVSVCEPNGGLPTGIILPTADEDPVSGQCGVDFYLGLISWYNQGGASLSTNNQEQYLGGPALDDEFGHSVVAVQDCTELGASGTPLPTWTFISYGPPTVSDLRGSLVCTVPVGPCCFDEGGCEMLSEFDCPAQGGTLAGLSDPSIPLRCEDDDADPDGDGVYFTCDNCPVLPNPQQGDCDGDGEGDACEASPDQQDDDSDGACNAVDPCPMDPRKSEPGTGFGQAPGICGCGVEDIDPNTDIDEDRCCIDECPNDPNKCYPGICGCGSTHDDNKDNDGDGYLNCVDTCPGIDDAVFGPCEPDVIPTLSTWGLLTLALIVLAVGKVCFARRKAADHA